MSLSPRAIALQGIGFPVRFVALQGIVPLPEGGPPPALSPGVYGTVGRNRRRLKKRRERNLDDDELLFLF